MKEYNSSDLTHKRSEVIEAARDGGAIIQMKETNGKVREEFVLLPAVKYEEMKSICDNQIFVFSESTIEFSGKEFKPLDFKGEE